MMVVALRVHLAGICRFQFACCQGSRAVVVPIIAPTTAPAAPPMTSLVPILRIAFRRLHSRLQL